MENREKNTFRKKIILYVVAGFILGAIAKLFVVDILSVSGNSMTPTIKDRSTLVVNKLAYGIVNPFSNEFLYQWAYPKKDDIVIFLHCNKIVVKRCIATQGTTLEFLADSEYILKVNNKTIPLKEEEYKRLSSFSQVPSGYVLVLGDNIEESIDSREYGFVAVKNITGKILGK